MKCYLVGSDHAKGVLIESLAWRVDQYHLYDEEGGVDTIC